MEKLVYFVDQNKKILMMFAAVFVTAAGAGLGYWWYQNMVVESPAEKYALRIGSHNITREEYQAAFEAAKQIQDIDESEFRDRYLPVQRELVAAQNLGVTVEQKVVDKQLDQILKNDLKINLQRDDIADFRQNSWLRLVARQQALQQTASQQATNKYQGSLFIFPFSRYLKPSSADFEKFGNQQAINQDKKYAKQQAEKYRRRLEQGQISAQELLQKINQDPRLAYMNSTTFGQQSEPWEQQVTIPQVVSFIETLDQPQVTQLQTGQVVTEDNEQGEAVKEADGYYYFVKLKVAQSRGISPGELENKAVGYEVKWYE